MSEKRVARLLGGYEVTIYPTALGELLRTVTVDGPAVKLLGPQAEPCVHYLTATEARFAAAALNEIADEIEGTRSGIPPSLAAAFADPYPERRSPDYCWRSWPPRHTDTCGCDRQEPAS